MAGFVQLPSLSLTVPAGNNFIELYTFINYILKFNLYIYILYIDEEHKLNKAQLSEIVERSIPSHIYILVSILISFSIKKLKFKNDIYFYSQRHKL